MSKINWNDHHDSEMRTEDLCGYLIIELIANNDNLLERLNAGKLNIDDLDAVLTK